MSMRTIASLAAIILTFGLLSGSGSVVAQETDVASAADTYSVSGCISKYVTESGLYPVPLPMKWCRNGRCEIFFEWGGEPMGAFSPGFGWAINFVQYPAAADHGWVSGPVIGIAGVGLGGGFGHNGDANNEVILGPWSTSDGSYMTLWDDSRRDRRTNRVTFELRHADPSNREIDYAKLFICRG